MIGTLAQLVNDMEKGVTNFCVDGNCIGCGACCSDLLPLSDKEVREIGRYIKKKHIQPTVRISPAVVNIDITCPFLDDAKSCDKCKIYPVRPKICRTFKCDTPPSKVRENKDIFWKTRNPYSMRDLFFGKER